MNWKKIQKNSERFTKMQSAITLKKYQRPGFKKWNMKKME